MKEHYDGNTPVVTVNCYQCGHEFEHVNITLIDLQEIIRKNPDALLCGSCDPQ